MEFWRVNIVMLGTDFYTDLIKAMTSLKKKSRIILVSFFSILFVCIILYIYYALVYMNVNILCPFYIHFDFNCLFCGFTRMIRAFFDLRIADAFHNNALFMVFVPLFVMLYIRECYLYIKYNKLELWAFYYINVFFISAIVFMILRNINTPIFDFLRPLDDYIKESIEYGAYNY